MSIVDAGTGSALLVEPSGSVVDSRDGNRQFGGRPILKPRIALCKPVKLKQ
jgi:hypothetical protein